MATIGSRTPASGTRTGADVPASEEAAFSRAAVHALLHRLSGGLNNAAMALELALSPMPAGDPPGTSERTIKAGLAGVTQAARAVTLLSELLLPAVRAQSLAVPLADVIEMLQGQGAAKGVTLKWPGDPASHDVSIAPA